MINRYDSQWWPTCDPVSSVIISTSLNQSRQLAVMNIPWNIDCRFIERGVDIVDWDRIVGIRCIARDIDNDSQ